MLVRHAGLSFRGTAAALSVFASFGDNDRAPDPTPCATTVRSWVLRLGYAQLTRPLSHQHRWAWLIDHTLQIGSQKLFVIVGVPLDAVPFGVRPLQLADLHLVAMVPRETSNFQRIDAELEKAIARTGVPRQIVSDGASDLPKGLRQFQTRHPQAVAVSDAAHVAANLLQHYWENDPAWGPFTRRMAETAATLRQTRSAPMLAPKLRTKARFMSVAKFVRFGRILLRKLQAASPEAEVVRSYGWVVDYAAALDRWHEQHELVQATLRQVRVEGLFARGTVLLDEAWRDLAPSDHPTTTNLRNRLRVYVDRGSPMVQPGERLIGGTEILESAFGVQKRLSRDQATRRLTGLSVGLGALLGTPTPEPIQADVERVPEKVVETWTQRTFGPTVQWLRRQFLCDDPPAENAVPNPG